MSMSITVTIETASVEMNHSGGTKTRNKEAKKITNIADLKKEIKNAQKNNDQISIDNPSTSKSIKIRDKEQNVILNNISTEEELNVYLNVLEKETKKRIEGYQK